MRVGPEVVAFAATRTNEIDVPAVCFACEAAAPRAAARREAHASGPRHGVAREVVCTVVSLHDDAARGEAFDRMMTKVDQRDTSRWTLKQ